MTHPAAQFHVPSALRIASEACVVELLREAGPEGLHVKDIAGKTEIDHVIMGDFDSLIHSCPTLIVCGYFQQELYVFSLRIMSSRR
jgi:hypothetical protein